MSEKKSAEFSTQKLAKISWETEVNTISQMDLPVWRTINSQIKTYKNLWCNWFVSV